MNLSRRNLLLGAAAAAGTVALRPTLAAAAASSAKAPPLNPQTLDLVVPTIDPTLGLVVKVGCLSAAQVRVAMWPTGRPDLATITPWVNTLPGPSASTHTVDIVCGVGLDSQGWTYQPRATWDGGTTVVQGQTWTIPGMPTGDYSFEWGGCHGLNPTGALGPNCWSAFSTTNQFVAFLGDMGYPDGQFTVQSYDGYMKDFRGILTHPAVTAVLSTTPFFGMQDDHDYGIDGACFDPAYPLGVPYATPGLHQGGYKSYAAQAYRDLVPGCGYPSVSYRNWTVGEEEYFLLDSRRHRDLPHQSSYPLGYRSQLGAAQWNWLKTEMSASSARLLVVFIPMTPTWDWGQAGGSQVQWTERAAMFKFFGTLGKPVLLITSDRHAGAAGQWGNVTEVLAGPMSVAIHHTIPIIPGTLWANADDVNGSPAYESLFGRVTISANAATVEAVNVNNGATRFQIAVPIP